MTRPLRARHLPAAAAPTRSSRAASVAIVALATLTVLGLLFVAGASLNNVGGDVGRILHGTRDVALGVVTLLGLFAAAKAVDRRP